MFEEFHVRIGELSVRKPFTIPSGIVTTVPTVIAGLARDIHALGFLTTKTISLAPRPGYREPIIHEYHPGCFINAVGLANPGARSFLESMSFLKPLHENKPLVVSIMGETAEEFLECAKALEPIAEAFELNLSCPHVKGAGQSVGSDPEMIRLIIDILKKKIRKPIIPKLSPNIPNFHDIVCLCEKLGADGLSLINTVGPGTAVDSQGNPVLSNINGGLSGSAIRPIGLKLVREAASLVKIPIIACGGISGPGDVTAYKIAGASLFGVGSALAYIDTKSLPALFDWLSTGIDQQTGRESHFNPPPIHVRTDYSRAIVTSNQTIAENMFELKLDRDVSCQAGQFFFLRLPGVGEKPFSPVDTNPLSFLVRAIGPFTKALQELRNMDEVQFRGPYGKGFPSPTPGVPLVMVGGGTGAGPIIMAAKKWSAHNPIVFLGFSSSLSIDERAGVNTDAINAIVAIDPPGNPGEVIRSLSRQINQNAAAFSNATVFLCGPMPMMAVAADLMKRHTVPKNIFMAREDIMRCGIGVCGSCGTPSGLRSCVDGPVIAME